MKKLFYKLEADDYDVTFPELDSCFEWIRCSCESVAKDGEPEKGTLEEDMPVYSITPVWMTQEEFESLPEAE